MYLMIWLFHNQYTYMLVLELAFIPMIGSESVNQLEFAQQSVHQEQRVNRDQQESNAPTSLEIAKAQA